MATKEQEKKLMLEQFIQKAEQRLEDTKLVTEMTMYVPSLEMELTFRSLEKAEIREILSMEDEGDPNRSDKYSVYKASTGENSLKELAKQLLDKGAIKEYLGVMEIFPLYEVQQIATKIMEASGVLGNSKVEVVKSQVKAIKN